LLLILFFVISSHVDFFCVTLLPQEHYGLRFSDFTMGFYADNHPSMPGMAYLELKGSVVTKCNKIKGSAPTLFETRNSRRLVDNPNDLLSPYRLYNLMRGFAHPDQEFVYCYKAKRLLLEQFSRLPACRGYQMDPTRRLGKNSIGKVRVSPVKGFFVSTIYFVVTYCVPSCSSLQFCQKLNEKAEIKDGDLFRNHCWREFGLGMIANNPNVNMAEQMAFSRHNNASSHIAYIRAGHNSDFAFQKAVSGAPMPKKKQLLQNQSLQKAVSAGVVRMPKKKGLIQKRSAAKKDSSTKKTSKKYTTTRHMKAPPSSSKLPIHVATRAATAAVRRSVRTHKPKKLD
jgi:hypothetical protein